MEESILENSKGATYMSFILDVEIVIKKEGMRANLAESKVKSPTSEAKEKEGNKIKQDAEPPGKQNEDKIYSMAAEPANIYNVKSKPTEDQSSLPLVTDIPEQTPTIRDTEINKDNRSQKQSEEVEKFDEDHHLEGPDSFPSKNNAKKRRISKTERKSKMFKGKVEPIDFLECNRIFMCNLLRIPNYKFHSDNNFTSQASHKSQSDHGGQVKSSVSDKKYKFWRRSKAKPSTIPLADLICENTYSSGDCNTKLTPEFDEKSLTDSASKNEGNPSNLINNHRNLMVCNLYRQLIHSICDKSDINIESLISEICISVDKKRFGKLFQMGRKLENRAAKKCLSLPNLKFNRTNIDAQKENHFEGFDLDIGEDSLQKRIPNDKNNISVEKSWKGLSNLEIKFFNKTDELIVPEIQFTNGETKLKSISGHNKGALMEAAFLKTHSGTKSRSAFQNEKEISTGNSYTTRSLSNINKLYVDNVPDTGFAIFVEYLINKRKDQLQCRNEAQQIDKVLKRKSFKKMIRNLSCLSSTSKE